MFRWSASVSFNFESSYHVNVVNVCTNRITRQKAFVMHNKIMLEARDSSLYSQTGLFQ